MPGTPMSTPCYPFTLPSFLPFHPSSSVHSFDPAHHPSFGPLERDTPESHAIWLAANTSIGQIKTSRNKEVYVRNFLLSGFRRSPEKDGIGYSANGKCQEIFDDPPGLEATLEGNGPQNSAGPTIENSRAIPERPLLIGKSWSLWLEYEMPSIFLFGRCDHTPPALKRVHGDFQPRVKRPAETILTFVLPAGLSMRYFANGSPFVV